MRSRPSHSSSSELTRPGFETDLAELAEASASEFSKLLRREGRNERRFADREKRKIGLGNTKKNGRNHLARKKAANHAARWQLAGNGDLGMPLTSAPGPCDAQAGT